MFDDNREIKSPPVTAFCRANYIPKHDLKQESAQVG